MRYTVAEKYEIIRLVEQAEVPVKQVLAELGIARSTFYDWYKRYQKDGYDGLADQSSQPTSFGIAFPIQSGNKWFRLPWSIRSCHRVN